MTPVATYSAHSKRDLIVHDSLAFLALLAVSVALFGVTLFLFRSFQAHRVDLAHRWSARGKQELAAGHPDEALGALRTALSYTPDGPDARADQLLLAQALDEAGHTEEATNYFLNLWDAQPGDGFINLQLARIARKKGDANEADNYYRAAVFGSWEGDGVVRRRQVRLELADYLTEQHLNAEARNELFTVAGNAPNDVSLNLTVGGKLAAAGYLTDAMTFYQKALASDPRNPSILELVGRTAYTLGDYAAAERYLQRALEVRAAKQETPAERDAVAALAEDARRMQQLTLTRDQPARERAEHILAAATVAEARLHACVASAGSTSRAAALASDLSGWTAADAAAGGKPRTLLQNASAQDSWTQLIYQTEQDTALVCGQPTGDDALLLRMADAAQPRAPAAAPPALAPPVSRPFFTSRLFSRKEPAKNGH
jgi:tetratricopeptide (TPR) repeat protein